MICNTRATTINMLTSQQRQCDSEHNEIRFLKCYKILYPAKKKKIFKNEVKQAFLDKEKLR